MTAPRFEGPFGYENWRANRANAPTTRGSEAFVYSDSRFSGEISTGLGPYQLINTIAMPPKGMVTPVFAMRMDEHLSTEVFENVAQSLFARQRTALAHYHGGDMCDEISALFSLALGVRFYAGPTTRRFDARNDPRGRPISPEEAAPSIIPGRSRPVIPAIVRDDCAIEAGPVGSYPDLSGPDALALARAARSYQEAIWVADGDPQLSWLLLVSAVETAAARWARTTGTFSASDADVLRSGNPELSQLLYAAGGEQLLSGVAAHIAQGMKAGHRFREFICTFAPTPPQPRPSSWCATDWTEAGLRDALRKIYSHRSKALHESTPFPPPMCRPPSHLLNDEGVTAPTEKPLGLSEFAHGGHWQASDTPMLLWVFEYIVRSSLMAWWTSLVPTATLHVEPSTR
jgi:hypothetical protein